MVNAADAINDRIETYNLYARDNGLTNMPISHSYSGYEDDGSLYIAGQTGVSLVNLKACMIFPAGL